MPRGARSTSRPATAARHQEKSRRSRAAIVGVVALAVVLTGALIWLGQRESEPTPVAALTQGATKGDPSAPVEIEVWSDFQCPACRQLAVGVGRRLDETLVAEGRARVVYRHLAFLGPESVRAAEASVCAANQGRFWEYHDALFRAQAGENRGAFSQPQLDRIAVELGLDRSAFSACMASNQTAARVRSETEAGRAKGVRATPTLFVNGQKIEGVPGFEQLLQIIEAAEAKHG